MNLVKKPDGAVDLLKYKSHYTLKKKLHMILRKHKSKFVFRRRLSSFETTKIYQQNPECNGYHKKCDLNVVLKRGYYVSVLGYKSVDWFVDAIVKLESKMTFYFENIRKDTLMTEEDEGHYRNFIICRFCEKRSYSDKMRDHCHLTLRHRVVSPNKCKSNTTEKRSNCILCTSHNFSTFQCHLFPKRFVAKKR